MTHKEMRDKIAQLETMNDMLLTEVVQLDHLLKSFGFEDGTASLKDAIFELSDPFDDQYQF
jgi:hypothetical protein